MRILILSPHSDDAELGCGATIQKLLEEDHEIKWLVFSTAEDTVPEGQPKDILKREFLENAKGLGLDEDQYEVYNFRVRRLNEHRQEVLEELVRIRDDFGPERVIGPSLNDFHQDHQVVANEMVRAFKTNASIMSYELPWNHVQFDTQLFIEVTEAQMERKFELLQTYRSQIEMGRPYFSREFIFGLSKVRGVQANAEYAEAFEVVRWMV